MFDLDILDEQETIEVYLTAFHKNLLWSEEKIGNAILKLEDMSDYKMTEWFYLKNDKDEFVG